MEKLEKMREIKFRIFNKTNNKYIYSDEFKTEKEIFTLNSFFKYISDMHELYSYGKLEQYTGLKDSKENPIYEGDIVHYFRPYCEDSTYHGYNEKFEIKWMILKNCGDCTSDSGPGFNFYLHEDELRYIEIIGNIYESPELLKEIK